MTNRNNSGPKPAPAEGRNAAGQFIKGQSGNPGGRPKKTAAEEKAIEMLKELTPEAVEVVVGILRSEKTSAYAKLQAAEIIFNRAMGRPETYLKVDHTEESQEEAAANLLALFEAAGEEEKKESGGTDLPEVSNVS